MSNLTQDTAEHMLTTGKKYTAATLAMELGISTRQASAKLYNIRESRKYTTKQSSLPRRTVKVISISGRKLPASQLWALAIFGKSAS
ncbi:hypothetical protein HWQ46_26740 [Shewanella sp. D64]|uniref:hypothetical protein n=1 Tax=unclassified Shewanella TaxID=196818 RepID=UPI0022BA4EAF|nr:MULTISPECIES: hypothetical protein [unclassified Shewanella]MEC4729105.1 hypothetical protein [Shewanella sp. D64]WBJ95300.1 hypothetical protein HWQ47_26525 [Shewanella sp. MTB7]